MEVKIETTLTINIAGAKWIITKAQAESLYKLLGEELKPIKDPYQTLTYSPR